MIRYDFVLHPCFFSDTLLENSVHSSYYSSYFSRSKARTIIGDRRRQFVNPETPFLWGQANLLFFRQVLYIRTSTAPTFLRTNHMEIVSISKTNPVYMTFT